MRPSLSTIFCLIIAVGAQAQPLTKELSPAYPTNFKEANVIVQDPRGIIWIGDGNGILRLDGTDCERVYDDIVGVSALCASGDSLWVGNRDGNVALLVSSGTKLVLNKSVSTSTINHISVIDSWVCFSLDGEGVLLANASDSVRFNAKQGLSDDVVYQTLWQSETQQLIASTDRGIDILEFRSSDKHLGLVRQFKELSLATSITDWGGDVLAGTYNQGVFSIKKGTFSASIASGLTEIQKFVKSKESLFVLTDNGIWEIDPDPIHMLNADDAADFIYIDEGLLLVLHKNGHLSTIDLRFSKLAESANAEITAIAVEGDHLYGATSGKLLQWERNSGTLIQSCTLPVGTITTRIISTGDYVYVGTFNEGLLKINPSTCSITQFNVASGLPDDNVLDLSLYRDTVWVVSLGGLSSIDSDGAVLVHPTAEAIGSTYIYSVLATEKGIYLGTDGKGIFKLGSGKFQKLRLDSIIENSTVYSLSADGDNVWLNTKTSDLYTITAE